MVTGGAKRLGAHICLALAQNGYRVAIHFNSSESEAAALAAQINGRHGEGSAIIFKAALDSQEEAAALPRRVFDTFGGLDLLVNNASIFAKTPLDSFGASLGGFVSVHVTAPGVVAINSAPYLRKAAPGRIINMVDVYADFAKKDYTPYAVTKAALKSLTRQLAVELAPDILVNAIAPGAITEPEDGLSQSALEAMLQRIPLRRFGQPEDIAKAVVFLASANYITGHTLVVDGGRTLTV